MGDYNPLTLQGWQLEFNLKVTVLLLKNVMFGSHKCAITTVQCTANHVNVCTETTLNIYSKTLILQL